MSDSKKADAALRKPEQDLQNADLDRRARAERTLAIKAAGLVALIIAIVLACWPVFGDDCPPGCPT